MSDREVSASTVVAAAPAEVFELLADPRRHREFDGSGTVRTAVAGPPRLGPGARFGMAMHWGLPYRIRNTVVEFEEGSRIAWRHFGRHVWCYRLEPVPGGTRITESFDWGPSLSPWALEKWGAPARNLASIRATLRRLSDILGGPA
ncbi:SRPBCC family protein [Pseudonocardia humida]|uniref:SRPBCC family protein n=1 Tax=Pseudonocardia humida TaxID=2800819 RepID=A0ABT0ZUK3_9PSEU|nr:SRPBCC family protein [Pseudonocardia humida]MCO1654412.1 SRPBCC family protein [Pseudonocardia humida]